MATSAERVILVPNSAVLRNAPSFMDASDWTLERGSSVVVRFHGTWCHMQPWLLAALGAWGLAADRYDMTIRVANSHTARYAWRMGLADYIGQRLIVPIEEHEEAGRFVAMRQIVSGADTTSLIADVAPLLHLASQPEQAKVVQYVLSEMIRNVLEHSVSPDGAVVAAQVYSGKHTKRPYVSLGVADCGVGMRATLAGSYSDVVDDRTAVIKGIQFGTSGAATRDDNAGAGLFYSRRLCTATGGYFGLISRTAMFRSSLAKRPRSDAALTTTIASYPGTIACVEIGLGRELDLADFLAGMRAGFSETSSKAKERAARMVRFS